MSKNLIPLERIENRIYLIRGQKVMLDRDIAGLYGVETKYLNRQVKRNKKRFPKEFVFQLTEKEKKEVVTNWHHLEELKFSYRLPFVFTEHGVTMLASVLNSEKAIKVSLLIIKVFVRLRQIFLNHHELAGKVAELEGRVGKQDVKIDAIFDAIRKLMEPPEKPDRKIGFIQGK